MKRNQEIALQMLDEIDQARTGSLPLDVLEERLWRLLDATEHGFSPIVAGKVDELVLDLRRLQRVNLASGAARDVDENRGAEGIFLEVTGALNRILD